MFGQKKPAENVSELDFVNSLLPVNSEWRGLGKKAPGGLSR